MEVVLCSLWLGRRLRSAVWGSGGGAGDVSVGLLRPIDWAALAKACPSSSSSSRGSAVNDGGEADKAFRARVRVEMDAAWTAMDGETTRLQRRLRQIEAAAARHGLGGRAGGAKGIGKEEEEEEEGMGDGGDGDDGALMEEGAAAMHGMRRPPPLPPSPVAEAAAAKRGTSDDAHDEAYWKERVAVALAEVHSRAAALAAGKGAYQQGAQRLLFACRLATRHRHQAKQPPYTYAETDEEENSDPFLGPLRALLELHPLMAPSKGVAAVMDKAELLYARVFCRGSVDVARTLLHAKGARRREPLFSTSLALRIGAFLALLLWAMVDLLLLVPAKEGGVEALTRDPAFKVFRGLGHVAFAIAVGATVLLVWDSAGIDYRRLLALPPSLATATAARTLLLRSTELSCLVLAALLLFHRLLLTPATSALLPLPHAIPPLLTLATLAWAGRRCRPSKLLTALRPTLLAPFAPVTLRDALVGDVWTSLVRVSLDVAFAALYTPHWLATGALRRDLSGTVDPISHTWTMAFLLTPCLTAMPLLCRLHQNFRLAWETGQRWPYYANSLKYAVPLLLSAFAMCSPQLHASPPWLLAFLLSTLFQTYWDVAQDWGILVWEEVDDDESQFGTIGGLTSLCGGRLRLRRTRLLFRSPRAYVGAMALNVVLRFSWSLSLLPESSRAFFGLGLEGPALPILLASAEIIRRGLWCLLRLEAAHLAAYRPVSSSSEKRRRTEGEEEGVEMREGLLGQGEEEEELPMVDTIETARLLTPEEARRAKASPHPTSRLLQVNGQTLDPWELALRGKRRQIARECGAMACLLTVSLGMVLLQAIEE